MSDNIVPFPDSAPGPLEAVEALCLTYLRRSKEPVVTITTLYDHCNRELQQMPLTRTDFADFLRRHSEITVFEGLGNDSPLQADIFAAAGIDLGPRAIVNDRMPTQVEMVQMMAGQLRDMLEALDMVREKAERDNDTGRMTAIDTAAARAKKLLESIKYLG